MTPPNNRIRCNGASAMDQSASGFTLVELLISSSIALIVMAALATLLGIFSRTASSTQAVVDLTDRMRSTSWKLRADLDGLTCDPCTDFADAAKEGYFELIEGPESDAGKPWRQNISYGIGHRVTSGSTSWVSLQNNNAGTQPSPSASAWSSDTPIMGDTDDVLLFTTRSLQKPFVGRFFYTEDTNGNGSLDALEDRNANNVIDVVNQIESATAEVAWFLAPAATQSISGVTVYNLYRRQMLVLPYVGTIPFLQGELIDTVGALLPNSSPNTISVQDPWVETTTRSTWQAFYTGSGTSQAFYDLSVRRVREDLNNNGVLDLGEDLNSNSRLESYLIPNSLSDLADRRNRFWRHSNSSPFMPAFPFRFMASGQRPTFDNTTLTLNNTLRETEDLLLTNVIAFDVRVFDPYAPGQAGPSGTVFPGDPGFPVSPTASAVTRGAYVDLGWGVPAADGIPAPPDTPFFLGDTSINAFPGAGFTPFQGLGLRVAGAPTNEPIYLAASWPPTWPPPALVYDTWNPDPGIGRNGLDDGGVAGVPDDRAEFEQSTPYPVPLRGIEVRIRCYEPTSKQIRQITIRHAFARK